MKSFAATAALFGLVAAVPKNGTATPAGTGEVVWTTEVVTAYTTYCPAPTTVVVNNKTHTVTEATTLTITDCPCTITRPYHTTTAGVVPPASSPECDTPVATAGPNPTGVPAEQDCPAKCYAAWIACKTAPGANQSFCASEIDKCLGFHWAGTTEEKPTQCVKPSGTAQASSTAQTSGTKVPTGPSSAQPSGTNPPVVNGAAGVAPFGVAAALAAIAML